MVNVAVCVGVVGVKVGVLVGSIVPVMVGVKVGVIVGVLVGINVPVDVYVGVRVRVGVKVKVEVGVWVGVTYKASTERKWICPPEALKDQFLHPAGTLSTKLINPAAELVLLPIFRVCEAEQAVRMALPTPVPVHS